MRLFEAKTKTVTDFDFILNSLHILSPYGQKRLKELKAFEIGREEDLRLELDKVEQGIELLKDYKDTFSLVEEVFAMVKDINSTIKRSKDNTLSVIELFEIKTFLLQIEDLEKYYKSVEEKGARVPDTFRLKDLSQLLKILDPDGEKINTFYLYDSFSEKLGDLRKEKRALELDLRRLQKEIKCRVEAKYHILMTPKFEYMVSKHDKEVMDRAMAMEELTLSQEDYMTATFTLKPTSDHDEAKFKMESINEEIDEEELKVRERLSKEIGKYKEELLDNTYRIGEADLVLAKANFAIEYDCVKPEILKDHRIKIKDGRLLKLQDILTKKGREYKPVSIELKPGVSCITGANMGGKTVTLKMIGQCAIMAQYAFFIPASSASIGLSSFVYILVGDSQNLLRGLSSFGSEMEELKIILTKSIKRALILIDEIASGTNPIEGKALTKSLINYLSTKEYISLVTTHFDGVAEKGLALNLQVRGLAGADFNQLSKEIRFANRNERIKVIGKYMDYSLCEVTDDNEAPKDALNIARILGVDSQIIEDAKKYMEDQ